MIRTSNDKNIIPKWNISGLWWKWNWQIYM